MSHSQPKNCPFFCFQCFLISFPGLLLASVPNHCLVRTDTCSNILSTYSVCLTLSFSKVKQQRFVDHTPCRLPAGSSPHCVRQWLCSTLPWTPSAPPLLVQLWVAACWQADTHTNKVRGDEIWYGFQYVWGAPSHPSELSRICSYSSFTFISPSWLPTS